MVKAGSYERKTILHRKRNTESEKGKAK